MSALTVALVDPQIFSQVASCIDRNTQDTNKNIFKINTYTGSRIAQSVERLATG
jgi:hypothetical protein